MARDVITEGILIALVQVLLICALVSYALLYIR